MPDIIFKQCTKCDELHDHAPEYDSKCTNCNACNYYRDITLLQVLKNQQRQINLILEQG